MVHIPDDPLYLYEFLDAYEYFGKWVAWERDEAHNGALAAASWRGAIEKTRETLLAGCGNIIGDDEMSDILDKLDEISERLKELEDMDVIVNQTVNGCGCCDGDTSGATQTVVNPIIDPTDTGISPPYDDTVYTVADAVKCRTANWLADSTISVIRGWANIGAVQMSVVAVAGAFFAMFAVLGGVATGGIVWGIVVFTIALLAIELAQLDDFQVDDLDVLAAEVESMREEFVCVMYGWTTSNELSAALLSFLYSRVDETATAVGWTEETKDKVKEVFNKIFGSEFSNYVVQNVGAIVPADFVAQYDCLCGATGDSCPTSNLVLAGLGTLPSGDLSGTSQGFGSSFNSQTGYYEIIFELAANYCVTIDNGAYTPEESHEKCAGGVMVASDGSCIRRFVARSQSPFGTAVTFDSQTVDCSCQNWSCLNPAGEIFDGTVLAITNIQGSCSNYVVNSFSMDGNRLTASFSVGYDPCWDDGFKITLASVGQHVRGWMFDDVILTGSGNAVFEGKTLVNTGASVNVYASVNSLWDSCFESQGYSELPATGRLENDNVFQLTMGHAAQGQTDTYTLQMTIRAINDLSL